MGINDTLSKLMETEGALACALVDYNTGMLLGSAGSGLDLEIAAAANTEVVRAKLKAIQMLQLDQQIDDILITLSSQYHLIRPLTANPAVFVYLAVDRKTANLGMARLALKNAEGTLRV